MSTLVIGEWYIITNFSVKRIATNLLCVGIVQKDRQSMDYLDKEASIPFIASSIKLS